MISIGKTRGLLLCSVAVLLLTRTHCFNCAPPCLCTGINITCSEQDLTSIPEFETINGANIVDLSSNQIEEIYDYDFNWTGIEQLQFLYLNSNSIVYIHEKAFVIFRNLEYLDLSNNCLEFIPSRMFILNDRLDTLLLSGNIFGKNVPVIMSESITHLDLSFTKLNSFTAENIKHLPSLKYLNLQANNIVYVNPAIFGSEVSVVLSYNIWACNCSTIDVYNWAKRHQDRITIDDPIKCMKKNNIYVDMFNKTDEYVFKESCDIDEATFGDNTIKELSLVKDNSTILKKMDTVQISTAEDEDFYKRATTIFVCILLMIILIVLVLGILLGVMISRYFCRNSHRNRRKQHLWII